MLVKSFCQFLKQEVNSSEFLTIFGDLQAKVVDRFNTLANVCEWNIFRICNVIAVVQSVLLPRDGCYQLRCMFSSNQVDLRIRRSQISQRFISEVFGNPVLDLKLQPVKGVKKMKEIMIVAQDWACSHDQ